MLMLWKCCLCEFLLITKQALWWKVLQKKLKTIKSKMEEAKQKGNKEIPEWLQEDEPFQELLNKVNYFLNLIRYL